MRVARVEQHALLPRRILEYARSDLAARRHVDDERAHRARTVVQSDRVFAHAPPGGTTECRCVLHPRYFPSASWTASATVTRVAATWCSNPFSQMYPSSSWRRDTSNTP